MTRTDIHAPSSPDFDPQAYELAGCFDLFPGDSFGAAQERQRRMQTVSALVDQGFGFNGFHGQCGHCGTGIRYAALMTHEASKSMIYIGETCLDNRFELTKSEFQALRKAAALNRERENKRLLLDAFQAKHPVIVWASYADNIGNAGAEVEWVEEWQANTAKPGTSWAERARCYKAITILCDLWNKHTHYVELSASQLALVERLLVQLTEADLKLAEREAVRQALVSSGVQAPEGRVQVTGKVVSRKSYESTYGYHTTTVWKMLVVLENGTKVWGTEPSSIYPEIGDTVTFTATFERKDDDPTFSTYKRPAKASIVGQG